MTLFLSSTVDHVTRPWAKRLHICEMSTLAFKSFDGSGNWLGELYKIPVKTRGPKMFLLLLLLKLVGVRTSAGAESKTCIDFQSCKFGK